MTRIAMVLAALFAFAATPALAGPCSSKKPEAETSSLPTPTSVA